MLSKPVLRHILENDALTRGLADPEARILVEWLVDQAEQVAGDASCAAAEQKVQLLCRKGRAISRFVGLWCHSQSRGAAGQLAAAGSPAGHFRADRPTERNAIAQQRGIECARRLSPRATRLAGNQISK